MHALACAAALAAAPLAASAAEPLRRLPPTRAPQAMSATQPLDPATAMRLRQAQAQMAAGMTEQGLATLRTLADENPDASTILRAYIDALLAAGQTAQAIEYLQGRTGWEARTLLARAQFLGGHKADADATWSALLNERSTEENAYLAVAEMRRALGDTDGAEATYAAGRKALKQPEGFALQLEQLHKSAGRIDAAMQDCLTLLRRPGESNAWVTEELFSLLKIARDPGAGASRAGAVISALDGMASQRTDSQEMRRLLLRVLLMQDRSEQALARASQWDRSRGGDRTAPSALLMLARVAADAADTTTATNAARRALTNPLSMDDAISARVIVATAAEEGDRLDEALTHYRALAAMSDAPDALRDVTGEHANVVFVEAPLKVAEIARRSGRVEEALAQYRRLRLTASGAPRLDDIRLAQADCYAALGRTEDAIALYDSLAQGAAMPLARERAVYGAAEAALAAGNAQDAAQRYRAVADLYPDGALVNDALGRILLIGEGAGDPAALSQYARAERFAHGGRADSAAAAFAALARNTSSPLAPAAQLRLAQLARDEGRADDALTAFTALLASSPNPRIGADALLGEADIYADVLHQPDKALDLYGEFLEKYASSVYATEVRQKAGRIRREQVK